MLRRSFLVILFSLTSVSFFACSADKNEPESGSETAASEAETQVVNVYTHRHYPADKALFAEFTEKTGIEVNVVSASADELIKRLEIEGDKSPADILITVDAGRLYRAKQAQLLQPIFSPTLHEAVPVQLRDGDNYWYGLTVRARIVAYAPERVDPADLPNYNSLTDARWREKLLVRSSSNIYNQSLMAATIAHKGSEGAAEWAQGIVNNMARTPAGNDRDQIKGIAAGIGDLAIVNSYYYNKMQNSDDAAERDAAAKVQIAFPRFKEGGVHINVSGAAVTASSKNVANALQLLEFLTSEPAQIAFANANHEFPVRNDIATPEGTIGLDDFMSDGIDMNVLGENNDKAVMIFDQVGWK